MRENASRMNYDQNQYSTDKVEKGVEPKKRLDLNDLLDRAKQEEKYHKKVNVIIFSGVVFILLVTFLLFI